MAIQIESDVRAAWGRALAATLDDASSLALSRLGVGPGWRCLVAGPGTAHLARWLAAAGGIVSTTDDALVPGSGPVEVITWRIGRDPIPIETFDLIVARLTLGRMQDPLAGIGELLRGVRPGGWIFAEDCDWVSLVGQDDPSVEQIRDACADLLLARGHRVDVGRRLPGLFRAAGLVDVDALGRVLTVRGHGSPLGELMRRTVEMLRADLLEQGRVSEDDIGRCIDRFRAPEFDAMSPVMVSVWGQVLCTNNSEQRREAPSATHSGSKPQVEERHPWNG